MKIKDLSIYMGLSEEEKVKINGELSFGTENIRSSWLREELEGYICWKADRLAMSTLRSILYPINVMAAFIATLPDKQSIVLFGKDTVEKKYRVYLKRKGYPVTRTRIKKERQKEVTVISEYISVFYEYWGWIVARQDKRSEKDKDVWDVRELGIDVRQNPISPRYRLDFTSIPICYRQEVKQAIYMQCSIKAMQTLQGEIRAAKSFFGFIDYFYPEIRDVKDLNREIYEGFLIWRKTQSGITADVLRRELSDLRLLFTYMAQLSGDKNLTEFSFLQDRVHTKNKLPVVYSQEELRRFNEAISGEEKQMVRALVLHELLGTRISDTLTLTKDCLSYDGTYILICQTKTHRTYRKHISPKTKILLQKSIEYALEAGIESDYIFADIDGTPWTYSKIKYHMDLVINKNDLHMDNGERFKFLTHQFRRTVATDMTEQGLPDRYIANELGHSSTRTVSKYRRVRNSEIKDSKNRLDGYFKQLYQKSSE